MNGKKWEIITVHKCLLGECPLWDSDAKRICWVDILKGEVHSFYPGSGKHEIFSTGQLLGAIALRRPGGIIAAIKGGFAMIDVNAGTLKLIAAIEANLPENRFNDGKCDPAGRFWAGTMSMLDTPYAGSLYVLEQDLTVHTSITGVSCSNGMAWSPDHQTFYYTDTPTRNIIAYDYEAATGNIMNGRVIISIPEPDGYPDGMTIDTEGMLWIALWGGGKVARYDPFTGKLLQQITLPVSRVSSCAFGGDTMEDLYITSASTGLSARELAEQPLSGSLFVIENSGFKGMEAFKFGS